MRSSARIRVGCEGSEILLYPVTRLGRGACLSLDITQPSGFTAAELVHKLLSVVIPPSFELYIRASSQILAS